MFLARGISFKNLLLILIVISASTSSPYRTNPTALSHPVVEQLPSGLTSGWKENLVRWLDLSYYQDSDVAGFSMMTASSIDSPDLYTTEAVIETIAALAKGQSMLSDYRSVAEWVSSLRNPEGFFVTEDPLRQDSPLVETQMAIMALDKLNSPPPEKGSTIDYLLSLQRSDGLFDFGVQSNERARSEEEGIAASDISARLLANLGFTDDGRLHKTEMALRKYLVAELSSTSSPSEFETDAVGTTILAIRALSTIDRSAVPNEAVDFVEQFLRDEPLRDSDLLNVSMLNNLLDVAEALGLLRTGPEDPLRGVRAYLRTAIFPQQLSNGGFAYVNRTIEPHLTYKVVQLATRIGVSYPRSYELLQELLKHHTDRGWVPFFSTDLNKKRESTYYALKLAKRIGFSNFDAPLVEEYFRRGLLASDSDIRELYYSLVGYKVLQPNLADQLRDKISKASLDAVRRLPENFDSSLDFLYFAMIAKEAGFSIPREIKDRIESVAEQGKLKITEEDKYRNLTSVYILWTLQAMLPEQAVLSKDQAEKSILSLAPGSNGFRGSPTLPADIHSTYLALQVLNGSGLVDRRQISSFVMSTKHKYGFNYVSQQTGVNEGVYMPDFRSTYEALVILDNYK